MKKIPVVISLIILIASCKTIKEKKEPVIEEKNESYQAVSEKKEKEYFDVCINLTEGRSTVRINSETKGVTPLAFKLEKGTYDMVLSREGYPDQVCRLEVKDGRNYLFRHNKYKIPIKHMGIYECGNEPKQVIFSPDDNYIFIPLLEDEGFQVFNMNGLYMEKFIKPPDPKHRKGYPEGLFIKEKKTFFISQMAGNIYEYGYPDLEYKRTISTGGLWSKFMTYSDIMQYIAVSNWSTNNVSIIDYISGKIMRKIPSPASPRGLAFSSDSKFLFVTSFDGGTIMKFDTRKWTLLDSIFVDKAAMRHIILNDSNTTAYVSNMYHGRIYEINVDKFSIAASYAVDYNPNTIDLTPDNKLLFVSSRGPNNPVSYLERSPRNGTITAIDVIDRKKLFSFEGGNQPTGLDVSNNGKYVCFSNFLDKNIEIYWIGDAR